MMAFPKTRAINEVTLAEGRLMFSKKAQIGKPRQVARARGALKISEHALTDLCEDYLEARGLCYIRVPDAIYKAVFGFNSIPPFVKSLISDFIKGLPDFTILLPDGRFRCIELKVDKNEMSQGQKHFAEQVPVVVCRDFETFKKLIEEFRRGIHN